MQSLRCVPPAPDVLASLFMDYVRDGKPVGLTFRQYLHAIGFTDPSAGIDGMDDGAVVQPDGAAGPMLISVPQTPIIGTLRIIVLLVDFSDQPATRPPAEFRDLLFSDGIYPTGSMRDYFREVSGGKVTVEGTVHGWLRLPQTYAYYVDGASGMGANSYPRSAQKMAEDAVTAALAGGVDFPPALDALNNGTITGLFVVHAGRGAEELSRPLQRFHIWSHKWYLPSPVAVRPGLTAATYLTVPEDCRMGVCAHELGHLAFQWEDFYDPNGNDDGVTWSGSGKWDLMAGGSWNGYGARPAHPAGLHKMQHDWLTVKTVTTTTAGLAIPPYGTTGGSVVKIVSPRFTPSQFLLLENRRRTGFDNQLPGEGLLVWRVDIDRRMTAPTLPALQLAQADGRNDLEQPPSQFVNQGDDGDPFPGSTNQTALGDTGAVSTSFRNGRSGVTLSNIAVNPGTGVVTLDVNIALGAAAAPAPGLDDRTVSQPGPAAAAGLGRLLQQRTVSPTELAPFVRMVTPTPLDLERRLLASTAERPPLAAAAAAPPFDTWWFRRYKATFGVEWDQQGQFEGTFQLEPRGVADYVYRPDVANPYRFRRASGEIIQPKSMITDGGSIPRIAWLIPGLDPRTFIKAYVIHDWDFIAHRCLPSDRSFAQVSLTLGEAIYTLMMTGEVPADWRQVETIYRAVSSFVGQQLWDRTAMPGECAAVMP